MMLPDGRYVSCKLNYYESEGFKAKDKFRTWDAELAAGCSYLCGSDYLDSHPVTEFVEQFKTRVPGHLRALVAHCFANPGDKLTLRTPRRLWEVCLRGDHVEYALPHHEKGGEKHWITKDGKTAVLVNID